LKNFEELYLALRKKEQRIYTDEEVSHLPNIISSHPHAGEWPMREYSCRRLTKYLQKKEKPLAILEIGCGNGWLSAQLAHNKLWNVTGIDVNTVELEQAQRVFGQISNLKFIPGDIRQVQLQNSAFDVIIFAASVQYFPSLTEIVNETKKYLKPEGEIHIIDTVFYPEKEVESARQRSKNYYTSLGFPEAAQYYFHHTLEELKTIKAKKIYDPRAFLYKLFLRKNPFYWVSIKRGDYPELRNE
jgi:ubiquinone/menaquinone biosynthesis C-methylase UbiE